MTVTDKISFRFRMEDERFARRLYADWERFFRQCVIGILDEFFSSRDSRDTCMEIEMLNLELGGISQTDFYEEFPQRLREALERAVPPGLHASDLQGAPRPGNTERTKAFAQEKRRENLLHYLEYGFCLPEWEGLGFDPEEELGRLDDRKTLERLLVLVTKNPNASERFFVRAQDELPAAMLPVLLLSPVPGHGGKQRYIATALERTPHAVLRFIRETKETGCVEQTALLLENSLVRQIMNIETENHAEIDLPEYWYRLYGWLLEYYPFNGVPLFGDKHHFRQHLNRSLLSFIRRRYYPSYLSKEELTVQFLTEVFGAEHGFAVLEVIYRNQPLNPDGSPASGDSSVREIYYMLLRLSFIKPGSPAEAVAGPGAGRENRTEGSAAGERLPEDIRDDADERQLGELLSLFRSPAVSDTRKSQLLRRYARWQPALLWRLIRYATADDAAGRTAGRIPFRQWGEWMGAEAGLELISGISLSVGETLRQANAFLADRHSVPETVLSEALVRFIAGWRPERRYDETGSDVIRRYAACLEQTAAAAGRPEIAQEASEAKAGNADGSPGEKAAVQNSIQEALSREIGTALEMETAVEPSAKAAEPDYIEVPNAGLCLLALWLPRLFDMLGLLEAGADRKRDLRDTEARIRAIFILQRLVTEEQREYKEPVLAFNRLLAGCPFHVPLPRRLELTDREIQAAESMLAGVKANWDKLENTSTSGFQRSFIERPGRLEQREEK